MHLTPRAAGGPAGVRGARRRRAAHPARASASCRDPADDGWDVAVPTSRVDVTPRGGPHRGSGAAPRLTTAFPRRFPALRHAAAAQRSASGTGAAPPLRDDRRRLLRGHDLRLHRRGRRRAVCAGATTSWARQPAVRDVRRPAALARAGPARRHRPQPPARAARRAAVRDRRALLAHRRRTPRARVRLDGRGRSAALVAPRRRRSRSSTPRVVVERLCLALRRAGVDRGRTTALAVARPVGRRARRRRHARRVRTAGAPVAEQHGMQRR